MLVVFGANGKTGLEVVKEALRRGQAVRPVAKNDLDTHRLESIVDVNSIVYADADHPEAIKAVLEGATAIVSCIDSRTAGFGAPQYTPEAGANIIRVADEMNITKMLHVSVMGGYRWSPNPLNKETFHMDIRIRRLKVPWTMLRVSCYHDEIIDGHVAPPDGGRPNKFHPSSRYSPVSRQDCGRVICNLMPDLIPNRTWLLGGPKVYSGQELEQVIGPHRQNGSRKSQFGGLPHGDFSVATDTTEIMVGWIPTETLEWVLDPMNNPIPERHDAPFWNRPDPKPHWSDQGGEATVLSGMDQGLRFALHQQLIDDLKGQITEIDVEESVQLDFKQAQHWDIVPSQSIYGATLTAMQTVDAKVNNGTIYSGNILFIYDELADSLHIWWTQNTTLDIPEHIWRTLDLGVRRRLISHPQWQRSPSVQEYAASRHERAML